MIVLFRFSENLMTVIIQISSNRKRYRIDQYSQFLWKRFIQETMHVRWRLPKKKCLPRTKNLIDQRRQFHLGTKQTSQSIILYTNNHRKKINARDSKWTFFSPIFLKHGHFIFCSNQLFKCVLMILYNILGILFLAALVVPSILVCLLAPPSCNWKNSSFHSFDLLYYSTNRIDPVANIYKPL